MKKFLKKNWLRLSIIGLVITSTVIGWLKYGKYITHFLSSGTDIDELERERRRDERRTEAGFERIDDTLGRADDLERKTSEQDRRVSDSSEQLSRTSEQVSDLNRRIKDRIQRNKDILSRL